ncbi:MAG: FtsX-like permease family protein [Oscillochloridaceae bacterium umkhey_bin13]
MIGSLAGVLLAYPLSGLLGRSGTFLLEWQANPLIIGGGVLVGALTALIFGADAALRATSVKPIALLRTTTLPAQPGLSSIRTLALGLSYSLIAGLIMGSVLRGAAVVAAGLIALVILGTLLSLICAGVVRLPLPLPGDLELARQGLRREPRRTALPLVAIFTGTLCVALAGSAISSAAARIEAQLLDNAGYNLLVQASPSAEAAVHAALSQAGAVAPRSAVVLPANVNAAGTPVSDLRTLEARPADQATWDLELFAGQWSGEPGTVLVPALYATGSAGWQVGDTLDVTVADGPTRTLRIAGFYHPAAVGPMGGTWMVLITAREHTPEAHHGGVLRVVASADPSQLSAVAASVGTALPSALVLSAADVSEVQTRSYYDLFGFVAAVAGLAFVAGAVLIANSVGLTLLQRHHELAVLKAVGFTRGRVLGLIALEHGLLGLLGGLLGLVAAWFALLMINHLQPRAELSLDPLVATGVGLLAVTIAVLSATLSAQRPVRVPPLAVFREG